MTVGDMGGRQEIESVQEAARCRSKCAEITAIEQRKQNPIAETNSNTLNKTQTNRRNSVKKRRVNDTKQRQ